MTATLEFLSLAAITFGCFISGQSTNDYKFIRNEKEISISSREIILEDGRATRELRAEFTVNTSINRLISAIKEDKLSRQWMQGIEDFSVISRSSENNWKAYIQYKIPWPLNNQDCIIDYTSIVSDNGNTYTIKLNGVPSYLPKKPGIERITHLSGRWIMKRVSDKSYRVVYTIYTEQKPKYPRWITDPIVQDNLINSMSAFRELTER